MPASMVPGFERREVIGRCTGGYQRDFLIRNEAVALQNIAGEQVARRCHADMPMVLFFRSVMRANLRF